MSLMRNCRAVLALSLLQTSFVCISFDPLSYTIALTENEKSPEAISRTLVLAINESYVGSIRYEVQLNASKPSFIHELHVDQSFRSNKGYGKMLLYHALKDILQSGSTSVELMRCAFDLPPSDNAQVRDEQLKKWYRNFGFQEDGERMMKLNPRKLLATEVVPNFSDTEITFSFRKPMILQKAAIRLPAG